MTVSTWSYQGQKVGGGTSSGPLIMGDPDKSLGLVILYLHNDKRKPEADYWDWLSLVGTDCGVNIVSVPLTLTFFFLCEFSTL
ncbi:hypothetical protein L211DRAFT_434034 [Terfezia boudieri ATCC MYA-4762]|uniref:Uncharacterized protein n=1 Tax=Terfezia boudieri ATCC MYA-4762 TaxID=1051890 RepID=A0A3N4LEX9_9PEZI|nr:hypothetical protein L211DRAFT_434034 [Terfezia boudieri ATCC MYA-4762]